MRYRYISLKYNLFKNENQSKFLNMLVANELFVNSEVIQFEEESELVLMIGTVFSLVWNMNSIITYHYN